jgi:cell cycle checkpoint protein
LALEIAIPAITIPPMGKRPQVVVLSSSSGEDDGGGRRGPRARRPRTPATAPAQAQATGASRKKPRRESSAGRGRRRAAKLAPSVSLKVIVRSLLVQFNSLVFYH